jgi:hypothetical protein
MNSLPYLRMTILSQTSSVEHGRMIHHYLLLKHTILHIHHQAESPPTGHHSKKARSRTSEAFSDSDLSNSADSYSTHKSCCRSAKLHNTTSVLTPITTLAVQPVQLQEACQRPPTTPLPVMTSVITATTDQSSLTSTIGDQLVLIQQQSWELEELKISLELIC